VNVVRFAFQTMVGIGTLLALLGLFHLYVTLRRRSLPAGRWFYWAVLLAGPASVVALIAGWITTEVGRQPWIVYRVLRTTDALTTQTGLATYLYATAGVYLVLAVALVAILRRIARGATPADPDPAGRGPADGGPVDGGQPGGPATGGPATGDGPTARTEVPA
jgi:cytochrome d ubiquinol oxidase subunit I